MSKDLLLKWIPRDEFVRVRNSRVKVNNLLALIADMCRLNTLVAVKRAGSGHLGSSFSSLDMVVRLYYLEMNTLTRGITDPDRDIYFSSKGHDVPGFYAVLYAAGIIPEARFLNLRRLGGLDGHPDVGVPGIEANSGSLGMGISKGRGMAWAKRFLGRSGRVFVMIGDGELQEGQNYEAFHSAACQRMGNLIVLIDHNKVQSDRLVKDIVDLGDLERQILTFGWSVLRCDGNDQDALEQAFKTMAKDTSRPKMLIADTIKGRGVSFMEHPQALRDGQGYYRWHAGAPADESYIQAFDELKERIREQAGDLGIGPLILQDLPALEEQRAGQLDGEPVSVGKSVQAFQKVTDEYVSVAYGEALLEQAEKRPDLVVLDADLAADCKIRAFELRYPERFIECGIAEQDMVSMAGGLARQGLLPVVNSFASFLASRANEQIYNNASEKTRIIYACHYAGLIPAGPGKSHQSIRDVSLLSALPNCIILQPCNADETRLAVDYAVNRSEETCALRLVIGPSPRRIKLPPDYSFALGCGAILAEGTDAVLFAYGPVMLHEALLAAEILSSRGLGLRVVNMPWLNRLDEAWLRDVCHNFKLAIVVEDHASVGGLGDLMRRHWGNPPSAILEVYGVEGYPACGTPAEALRHHQLDGASLTDRIQYSARMVQKGGC